MVLCPRGSMAAVCIQAEGMLVWTQVDPNVDPQKGPSVVHQHLETHLGQKIPSWSGGSTEQVPAVKWGETEIDVDTYWGPKKT